MRGSRARVQDRLETARGGGGEQLRQVVSAHKMSWSKVRSCDGQELRLPASSHIVRREPQAQRVDRLGLAG